MRLAGAVGPLLLAISLPAAAQQTLVRLPENVYISVPFTIELDMGCPPPGEAPPPFGCQFPIDVWFATEARDKSASLPPGIATVSPFEPAVAGPFVFHKPGQHRIDVYGFSFDFPDEIILVGQAIFTVDPPGAGKRKK
jgi:hypothetical protein